MNPFTNVTITNNVIGPGASGTDSVWYEGMIIQGVDQAVIDGNDIQRLYQGTGTTTIYGALIQGGTTNLRFTRNKVHNTILRGAAGQYFGIYQNASAYYSP